MRAAAALLLALAGPAEAQECRLALVLALDVSSSVDAAEDVLQRDGLAAALTAPEVRAAFLAADLPVALAIFEWSGRYNQQLLLDWTLIDDDARLFAAADRLARSSRHADDSPTALGHALGYGAGLLARAPDCLFETIDVAGDGVNNEGFPPAAAYRHFPLADVTVNGLAIGDAEAGGLPGYYRAELIGGPRAFVEVAADFADYERAMRRKLLREVAATPVGKRREAP
ncbi:hypothetical protein OG2516_15644 [Oceanicola granulosus HTCC2516]|uniref:von Willebrand factor type A domain prot n=1 Tax=Oceanicola granulosus (strain ATCC BAA-861 / DSM 15982 / KCTC 12143 / HTCC2516) TaxID=314256 RepID=Q2CF84_OCEGH|nr:hypothetical protein OG2516_15644 [Oceanicola granulosus HTCC2516]